MLEVDEIAFWGFFEKRFHTVKLYIEGFDKLAFPR